MTTQERKERKERYVNPNIISEIFNHIHALNVALTPQYLMQQTPLVWLANCHPLDRNVYKTALEDAGFLPKKNEK